ncbi:MAG: TIGR00725 family protein [Elusimicrobia bacterium]|nr:TIGR00725 family protein [Elusimicrobiota bacterium]
MKMVQNKKNLIIGVLGGNECSGEIGKIAYQIGQEIAKAGHILICGGLGGVMEHACKGAKEAGGLTIGILPGKEKFEANDYIDIPIVTAMSHARNAIIVRTADILVAIGGKYGTLSEIALAKAIDKPVYGLKTWEIDGVIKINKFSEIPLPK